MKIEDWQFSDEALTHLKECRFKEAPMDVCDCQQKILINKITKLETSLADARKKLKRSAYFLIGNNIDYGEELLEHLNKQENLDGQINE